MSTNPSAFTQRCGAIRLLITVSDLSCPLGNVKRLREREGSFFFFTGKLIHMIPCQCVLIFMTMAITMDQTSQTRKDNFAEEHCKYSFEV